MKANEREQVKTQQVEKMSNRVQIPSADKIKAESVIKCLIFIEYLYMLALEETFFPVLSQSSERPNEILVLLLSSFGALGS